MALDKTGVNAPVFLLGQFVLLLCISGTKLNIHSNKILKND